MSIAQGLLAEFDQEMVGTRKTLERIPEDKFDWAPHPKSTKLGPLATHLAQLPSWTKITLIDDSIDIGNAQPPTPQKSRKEILAEFDKNVAEARQTLTNAKDEDFFKPWSLKNKGQVVFTLPKIAVMRGFVMNHNVHHRAQLGVYLRLCDVPVPSIYGPSADEKPF
jgi:uncharacterized damage-inducible protein DinB